jgi:hypothetical protein
LLLRKFRGNEKLANQKFLRNIKDITQFFQRYPDIIEQELIYHPILPSYLHDKPIPARLDAEFYLRKLARG